ncbi:MAG TPA: amino acid permease [Chthoniobacteraceae bacterium]|jgi:amino acid transporter/nucleotide-binding universal stress UspA family protein|nr:amino acid permease [Chthoniobacteraceae bacterium]
MIATGGKRPRNVDWKAAAAILYGDWGTSKAYVIGLAFAVAGYSSFWLILPMCLLTALVGINYSVICRHYPDGGGVYASVRHRSEIVSIVGAFLLIADYIVTAAISALSAFQYFQGGLQSFYALPDWTLGYLAAGAVILIGALNYFGPKHTGGLAFLISLPTVIVVVALALFTIPHLHEAVHVAATHPLKGGFMLNWSRFVGVVLALSGVEAIANATGVMQLDPGSTDEHPKVSKTSNKALLIVAIEVCGLTALLGLAMQALHGLTIVGNPSAPDVNGPGAHGVRDYMLNYMANVFVGGAMHNHTAGLVAGIIVSFVFGLLLLSAVNTAIVDLIAISFLMSRDGEVPDLFQKLNRYGVPNWSIIFAVVVPAILVASIHDMSGLADLYAVGVVGAIATNLGASSTDWHLDLKKGERVMMFCTFVIMALIEISLFIYKPNARLFTLIILAAGLIARGLVTERRQKKEATAAQAAAALAAQATARKTIEFGTHQASGAPLLAAIRGIGRTLDFAIEEARETDRPLYLLFIREQPVVTREDKRRKWTEDEEAFKIFEYAAEHADGHTILPCYAISESPADTIVDVAATVGASRLILGAPQRNALVNMLRGNIIRNVSSTLPEDIHLLVYA